jgi:hypothetical protein
MTSVAVQRLAEAVDQRSRIGLGPSRVELRHLAL